MCRGRSRFCLETPSSATARSGVTKQERERPRHISHFLLGNPALNLRTRQGFQADGAKVRAAYPPLAWEPRFGLSHSGGFPSKNANAHGPYPIFCLETPL